MDKGKDTRTMSSNSDKPGKPKIVVDELMSRIGEEVVRRKTLSPLEIMHDVEQPPADPIIFQKPSRDATDTKSSLWKFGLKHAKLIKKIPVIRHIAEKFFWYLFTKQSQRDIMTIVDLDIDWNYQGFLERIKQEGLKGKIKVVIFKFIGFFAWWQGQLNRALHDEIVEQKDTIDRVERQMRELLSRWVDDLQAQLSARDRVINELTDRVATASRQAVHDRLTIMDMQNSMSSWIEEATKRLPEPFTRKQIEAMAKQGNHALDEMYLAFENHFRGTREDIRERQKVYLPYIKQARAGTDNAPVLDVGCGRGEWLELLRENGYAAHGVDSNRSMIRLCREYGLDAVEADVIDFIRGQEANHFGAITGFHIVEHLPLKILLTLLDEARRVLHPKGLIMLETPNPENLMVGAFTFYHDPTHLRPITADALRFLLENRGFITTDIIKLHRHPDHARLKDNHELWARWIYSEMDYACIAHKDSSL